MTTKGDPLSSFTRGLWRCGNPGHHSTFPDFSAAIMTQLIIGEQRLSHSCARLSWLNPTEWSSLHNLCSTTSSNSYFLYVFVISKLRYYFSDSKWLKSIVVIVHWKTSSSYHPPLYLTITKVQILQVHKCLVKCFKYFPKLSACVEKADFPWKVWFAMHYQISKHPNSHRFK